MIRLLAVLLYISLRIKVNENYLARRIRNNNTDTTHTPKLTRFRPSTSKLSTRNNKARERKARKLTDRQGSSAQS